MAQLMPLDIAPWGRGRGTQQPLEPHQPIEKGRSRPLHLGPFPAAAPQFRPGAGDTRTQEKMEGEQGPACPALSACYMPATGGFTQIISWGQ